MPTTPFKLQPFKLQFQNPIKAQRAAYVCNDDRTSCISSFYNEVKEVTINLNGPNSNALLNASLTIPGCKSRPTSFLTYNGSVPGPMFMVPAGTQVHMRMNNTLKKGATSWPEFPPAGTTVGSRVREGRCVSCHHHGSASLAPWDGWAQDSTCGGEVKDYLYPANRPGTGWYHDHQFDITAANAYAGLASFFIVSEKLGLRTDDCLSSDPTVKAAAQGCVPERWGLENMEEYQLILNDKVLNSSCQLLADETGAHLNGIYGDINLVSGFPWPVLNVEQKWVRFRLLNGGPSRPYIVRILDSNGVDVGVNICQVIAGDGGYRQTPAPFPQVGLFIGVAERYEIVCNFTDPALAKPLYLWNHKNSTLMPDVPFFCYSHLLMKINITGPCTTNCGVKLDITTPNPTLPTEVDKVISGADMANLTLQAKAGRCDRTFVFGRSSGGQWVINGETWDTVRLAANVTANTLEIWCLKSGGGWFHPIHIHLVDFYVLQRILGGVDTTTYEKFVTSMPKDVVQLYPNAQVSIVARWGPHRGEYMFHCHNLRHEDNLMMRSFRTGDVSTEDPAIIAGNLANITANITNMVFLGNNSILYDQYWVPVGGKADAVAWADALDTTTYLSNMLALEPYRLFYPAKNERKMLCNTTVNPWPVNRCPDGTF